MRRDIEPYPAHSRKCRSDSEERRNSAGKRRNFFRFVPPHFRPCGADSRAKQREQSASSSTVPFPALSSDARQGKQPCQSVSCPILCHNSVSRPVFKAGHAPSGNARQSKQPFDTPSHFLPARKAALSRFPPHFVLQFRFSSHFQRCFPLHLVAQGRASRLAKPFPAHSCKQFCFPCHFTRLLTKPCNTVSCSIPCRISSFRPIFIAFSYRASSCCHSVFRPFLQYNAVFSSQKASFLAQPC